MDYYQSVEKFYLPETGETVCQYRILPGTDNWYSVILVDSTTKKITRLYETREPLEHYQTQIRLKNKNSVECVVVTGMFPTHLDASKYNKTLQSKIVGKIGIVELTNICIKTSKKNNLICWVNTTFLSTINTKNS